MKILLVEDNEENRDALSRRLARRGYEIVMAGDGQQAISMAQAKAPVLDGWEATRLIKALPATRADPGHCPDRTCHVERPGESVRGWLR